MKLSHILIPWCTEWTARIWKIKSMVRVRRLAKCKAAKSDSAVSWVLKSYTVQCEKKPLDLNDSIFTFYKCKFCNIFIISVQTHHVWTCSGETVTTSVVEWKIWFQVCSWTFFLHMLTLYSTTPHTFHFNCPCSEPEPQQEAETAPLREKLQDVATWCQLPEPPQPTVQLISNH